MIGRGSPTTASVDIPVASIYKGTNVATWRGDMTRLEIGAIVNAANSTLMGGGGIDGAIHRAAGPGLRKECRLLNGCKTGQTKITKGHNLPAQNILHTVGPIGEKPAALESCYRTCLDLAVENGVRSVCFCCISTGVFGYPNQNAATVALTTVKDWLDRKENQGNLELIVFCTFMQVDVDIYGLKLPQIFVTAGYSKMELDAFRSAGMRGREGFWPISQQEVDRMRGSYKRANLIALEFKGQATTSFKSGDSETALRLYTKALFQFDHIQLGQAQVLALCMGTHARLGENSSVAQLCGNHKVLSRVRDFVSGSRDLLSTIPVQRTAAECASNASMMLLRLLRPAEAASFAKLAFSLDRTFSKALMRLQMALVELEAVGKATGASEKGALGSSMGSSEAVMLLRKKVKATAEKVHDWPTQLLRNGFLASPMEHMAMDQWRADTSIRQMLPAFTKGVEKYSSYGAVGPGEFRLVDGVRLECSFYPLTPRWAVSAQAGAARKERESLYLKVDLRWVDGSKGGMTETSIPRIHSTGSGLDFEIATGVRILSASAYHLDTAAETFASSRITELVSLLYQRYFSHSHIQVAVPDAIEGLIEFPADWKISVIGRLDHMNRIGSALF
jgi:O-acetyl-ADP-ribose deacetylase (regulator of RNase III)